MADHRTTTHPANPPRVRYCDVPGCHATALRMGRYRGRDLRVCAEHSSLLKATDLGVQQLRPVTMQAGPAWRHNDCPGCGMTFEKHAPIVVDRAAVGGNQVWHDDCWSELRECEQPECKELAVTLITTITFTSVGDSGVTPHALEHRFCAEHAAGKDGLGTARALVESDWRGRLA